MRLCLAAGYRVGTGWLGPGKGRGLKRGRTTGQLLQEFTAQKGGVLGLGDVNGDVKSSPKSTFKGQRDTFEMENAVQRREKNDLYKWPWIPHHNITPNNAARIDSVPGPILKALFFNFLSLQNKYIRSICYLHFPEAQISIATCSVPHGEISHKQFMCQLENSLILPHF